MHVLSTIQRVLASAAVGLLLLSTPIVRAGEEPSAPEQTGWIVGELRAFAFGPRSDAAVRRLHQLGWIECAGQTLATKDYPELHEAIGETWGVGSSAGFLVPDLRGRLLHGWQTAREEETHGQLMGGDLVKGREDARPARLRPERAEVTYFIYVGRRIQ